MSKPHSVQDDLELVRAGVNYYTREYRDDRPWQALRRLEEQYQALREAVDVQLGRHLCYTSEANRAVFWRELDKYLALTLNPDSLSSDAERQENGEVSCPASEPTPLQRAYGGKVRTVSTDPSNQESSHDA